MSNQRTLVIFSSLPLVGGHTIITLKLCELLLQDYPRIFVICKEMPGHGHSEQAAGELRSKGVTIIQAAKPQDTFTRALLKVFFRIQSPDVFLSIGMRHLSPVLAIALKPRLSLHYHITHELTPKISRQLSFYARFFSKLVFISPATWVDFSSANDSRKAFWAVQATELHPLSNDGCKRKPGPIRLGFLGRLNEAKGSATLLKFLSDTPTSCELHVAGSGEFEKKFSSFGTKQSPTRQVIYHGAFDAGQRTEFLGAFFGGIDYLCVPSQDDREGVPTVILEALQHGVPVIATNCGGTRSFGMKELGPAPQRVVRLVEPSSFAHFLDEIVSMPPPPPSLSLECTTYYRDHFSDHVLKARWHSLLETSK